MSARVSSLGLAVLGMGLIALTYGLARFVFGLFLPAIRDDLAFSPATAGLIGALPFVTYNVGILAAPVLTRWLGTRWAAASTAGCAATGLASIAEAPSIIVLSLGVAACGLSTGLSSPIMAASVTARVPLRERDRVNALINAGTGLGIALGMPVVMMLGDTWRPAYLGFALVAGVVLVACAVYLPNDGRRRTPADGIQPLTPVRRNEWVGLTWLSLLAGAMGMVSAVYWVFAPDFAVRVGGLSAGQSAWIWLAVGLGGLVGLFAGDLVNRWGAGKSHAGAMACLAVGLGLLTSAPGLLATALVSAVSFGAAYMILTGIYLVASIQITPHRPALAPVMPFIAIAVGQAGGSPLAGAVIERLGHEGTFLGATVLALVIAAISPPLGGIAMRPVRERPRGNDQAQPQSSAAAPGAALDSG